MYAIRSYYAVADQGVGAEADPLPAEEEEEQVVGEDDGQHGEDEEVEEGEEAGVVGLSYNFV